MSTEERKKLRKATQQVIEKLVKQAGTQTALAIELDVTQPMVSRWLQGVLVSPTMAITIEKRYGIPRKKLRPDLFN